MTQFRLKFCTFYFLFKIFLLECRSRRKVERSTQCDYYVILLQYNLTQQSAQELTRATSVVIKKLRSTSECGIQK